MFRLPSDVCMREWGIYVYNSMQLKQLDCKQFPPHAWLMYLFVDVETEAQILLVNCHCIQHIYYSKC